MGCFKILFLSQHLMTFGFITSHVDLSLFVKNINECLFYIDDIILRSNENMFIDSLVDKLRDKVNMIDLGALMIFLRLEVQQL